MIRQKHFRETWDIDILATTPRKAAQRALHYQRNSESIATVFGVTEMDVMTARRKSKEKIIDLTPKR